MRHVMVFLYFYTLFYSRKVYTFFAHYYWLIFIAAITYIIIIMTE